MRENKPAWPAGLRERIHALGPLPDDLELPEPLPESPHRDEALERLDEE